MAFLLLIDDDTEARTMMSAVLRRAGFEVREARNGREGLLAHQEKRPDLVITDLVMPEDEGIAVITSLRREDPTCKIIAISGASALSETLYLPMALKLGAARALSKPFNGDELLAAVNDVLGLS